MISPPESSYLWLVLAFLVLMLAQRQVQRHVQGVGMLLTGSKEGAVTLYFVLFLPGVVLHELSHWLMALFLGVRAGKIAVWPSLQQDGTVQLGYVETTSVGAIRESLIGAAPILAGVGTLLVIGYRIFDLGALVSALSGGAVGTALSDAWQVPDLWLWLYLIFAVSNAMLPSASDRRAWRTAGLYLALAVLALLALGAGNLILAGIQGPLADAARYLATAFSITIAVDALCLPLIWGLEVLLGRLLGKTVVYREGEP